MDHELRQRLEQIEQTLSGLYLPGPMAAEKDRPRRPIEQARTQTPVLQDPLKSRESIGSPIWTSPGLETHGFSHQDAFLEITVWSDTVPAGLGFHPVFLVELQGACGSCFCPIASTTIWSNGRLGVYPVPVLSASSLSLEVRVQIFGADNADYEPPVIGRVIEFSIDGMLVAGYEM
jgi:hypothetical protein